MPGIIRPAMSDGRSFTNYLSRCEFENSLKQNFAVTSESEYRRKLQENPRAFALRARQYADFMPYHAVNICPSLTNLR